METSLMETYRFLKVAAHLWDRHFQRIENAQVLVLQDLANTVEKNSRSVNVRILLSNDVKTHKIFRTNLTFAVL